MAPSRKKGGSKAASARREWKVGDLVLAKVKGFPAWPAAVSAPEKWGYSADLKKVLVHFFGTQQIALCNPADVELFTEEKKQSLMTKRHAKGSDFVRAVKEIIENYEKLKQQEQASDPKSAEESTVGSSENTVQLPRACESLIDSTLDTQIKSNSSHDKDELTLLSSDASAAEQMLALRHNTLAHNGTCDSAAAKGLCEIATYSSRRRNERVRALKCAPQEIILPIQQSKISSSLELNRLERSMLECRDGGQSVDGIDDRAIRRRKRIQWSGHSESNDVVSSALNLDESDEANASEIATVESDSNSRNEGNGVASGSKVDHSDAVGDGCDGDHELNKGLDFQISSVVKRKKRKTTRKRETCDLIDPLAKIEAEVLGANSCDSSQRSQNSHERLNERPCEGNGDEHLPLVKRARVRMSKAFYADEKVNASSSFEERSSNDTLISAAMLTSPPVNHENDIVYGHDTSAAKDFNSFELSAKLPCVMVDVPSHIEKPSDKMSPSRAGVLNVESRKTTVKFHETEFTMRIDDEVTRAQSYQLNSLAEEKAHVPEVVHGFSEESQTGNCLNSETDPVDALCLLQSEKNETPLNPDTIDSSANKSPRLSSSFDMTTTGASAQFPHQHQSQEYDSFDHTLVIVGDSLHEKCEKIDNCMTQAVEPPPLFSSVVNNQEAENTQETENMQESENNLLKENQGSLCKDLGSEKQALEIQNPALSGTENEMILEEAEPQYETVYSHCEDALGNRELEMSYEIDEQKEKMEGTNSILVSENLSHEKLSSSPANVADSPAKGTPHCNSLCYFSSTESASVMQNNCNCSTKSQFGEKKLLNDYTVKEESKVGTSATQVKKVINSDVQCTIESFETALGSLVRTKETIGRATRLAMDLAKFGVSTKAMEILAHTLESESNLQRRVDFFFLVDSIAQCSKGLNGDAGGVYLSSIQAMLPRLLAAAVPAGATTQENQNLCLKVLRVWLKRQILPESIVRHHIRELDSLSNVPACLYSRRSARTERALDDPVRDMEGMLVDEYGSNSTLQLHGFCMPTMLKDEDEESDSDEGDFESVTPEHESRILEEHVTPSITERHTRILEDVDGELEMEDVAPPWEAGSSAITDQADNAGTGKCQPVSGTSHQNVTSSSPPAPPLQNAQCAMSDSYSNPSMHGNYQPGPPRMNPPMHYGSSELSYSSRLSLSESLPRGEGSKIQHRPYPSSHLPPPPAHQYSYMEPDHHVKSRREGSSYPHRSHYTPEFDERNYHESHERMRPAACENRDNWRYHPPSSHGPRYHDRYKGPYQPNSYSGHHRDSGRLQNNRWSQSPRAYNNRQSFHYKQQHSEGPVPVGMRDPGTWHQR